MIDRDTLERFFEIAHPNEDIDEWSTAGLARLTAALEAVAGLPKPDIRRESDGPEAGHTFEVSVKVRGSGSVEGEPKTDANWWGSPDTLRVRAWNRRDALLIASQVSMGDWRDEDDEADAPEPECHCSDSAIQYNITDPGCPRHDPNGDQVSVCSVCSGAIERHQPQPPDPSTTFWSHFAHPEDDHDAVPVPQEDDDLIDGAVARMARDSGERHALEDVEAEFSQMDSDVFTLRSVDAVVNALPTGATFTTKDGDKGMRADRGDVVFSNGKRMSIPDLIERYGYVTVPRASTLSATLTPKVGATAAQLLSGQNRPSISSEQFEAMDETEQMRLDVSEIREIMVERLSDLSYRGRDLTPAEARAYVEHALGDERIEAALGAAERNRVAVEETRKVCAELTTLPSRYFQKDVHDDLAEEIGSTVNPFAVATIAATKVTRTLNAATQQGGA